MQFKEGDQVEAKYSSDHKGVVTGLTGEDGEAVVQWRCENCDIDVEDFPFELRKLSPKTQKNDNL